MLNQIGDGNIVLLNRILEGEHSEVPGLSMAEKVADAQNFEKLKSAYGSCKDDAAARSAGVTPLVDMLGDFRKTWYSHESSKDRITAGLLWVVQNSVSALIRITIDVSFTPMLLLLHCTASHLEHRQMIVCQIKIS